MGHDLKILRQLVRIGYTLFKSMYTPKYIPNSAFMPCIWQGLTTVHIMEKTLNDTILNGYLNDSIYLVTDILKFRMLLQKCLRKKYMDGPHKQFLYQ